MNEIANLLAKMFIARPSVRAVQMPNGEYITDRQGKEGPYRPFNRLALMDHISGVATYGHYLIEPETNDCKLFAFDIDFEQKGYLPVAFDDDGLPHAESVECNPRQLWRHRDFAGRQYMKGQLMHVANLLASKASRELELPVAVAYSGFKGVHVYCFTGRVSAAAARQGAQLVLELAGAQPLKGKNFFVLPDGDVNLGNISIETYPKQDNLDGGKTFGNLMRLPLGVNRKAPTDPTFFIDLSKGPGLMTPVKGENIVKYLETGDPWK